MVLTILTCIFLLVYTYKHIDVTEKTSLSYLSPWNNCFVVYGITTPAQRGCFIGSRQDGVRFFTSRLYAVPKKKPSRRRTRIRKTAWMKRYPNYSKKPMMLDMFDITKYTDGTFTKARSTHQNWLNLPNTSLEGEHILNKEIRPSW